MNVKQVRQLPGGAWKSILSLLFLIAVAVVVVACSSGNGSTSGTPTPASGATQVNVRISDPATCQSPSGPYSHVFVTITDVQANVTSTAGDNDSGWTDLTPALSKAPMQVDLLGSANNQCFLATLGDTQQLQAGSYRQIRIILADNSATVANNACNGSANCVVLASDSSVHELMLSSESKTGLKIPSGQIAGGAFSIAAGQTKDLDIDFITCQSIVRQGNGKYRLKPVLHAGEVSITSTSINGKVLDGTTGNPVNGSVMVAVEQPDASGIDRIQRATVAGADGSFVFCPLPAGTYDVVIVGTRADGALYEPSIITGISVGSTTGSVNLFSLASAGLSSATLNGTVTSQNSANPAAGTVTDVELSVLETINGATFTIPLAPTSTQDAATLTIETAAPGGTLTCPAGTYCASYSMSVSSASANVGSWTSAGTMLNGNLTLATYKIDGVASVPSSGGLLDCSPSEMMTPAFTLSAGGVTVPVQTIGFTMCQ
jgi:Domain of unknown function (DUF4382)